MTGFTDTAHTKMMDLFNDHRHECGSQIASAHPAKTPTDCITYIFNVLTHAFTAKGDKDAVDAVKKHSKMGTDLAKWLVTKRNWTGIYYNPDVAHPRDGQLEHPESWFNMVVKGKQYYGIPISHAVINYKPTPHTHPKYTSFSGMGGWKCETPDADIFDKRLAELKKIKFAIGVSRGGKHTWMYSLGEIFEVHWDQIGPDLYERSPFENYDWISGALAVPPDAISAAQFDQGFGYYLDVAKAILGYFGEEIERQDRLKAASGP